MIPREKMDAKILTTEEVNAIENKRFEGTSEDAQDRLNLIFTLREYETYVDQCDQWYELCISEEMQRKLDPSDVIIALRRELAKALAEIERLKGTKGETK